MAIKGFFKPKNPSKYQGNLDRIIYRSSWELKVMRALDKDARVKCWQSERIAVPYIDPTKNQRDPPIRRYFPDFVVTYDDDNTFMYEVKPKRETRKPTTQNKRRLLKESIVYARNIAKWKAAKHYCDERGWHFRILTEDDLFRGKNL